MNLQDAAIYVGTYGKYNSGSLEGKWLKLSDYSDAEEFYQACAELHANEPDPEYMFQDYENIPAPMVGESWLSDKFWPLRDLLSDEDEDTQDAFFVYADNYHIDLNNDPEDTFSQFQEAFCGFYDSEEDYAYDCIQECCNLEEMMGSLSSYFDYEAYANNLFSTDYWYDSDTGAVFRSF